MLDFYKVRDGMYRIEHLFNLIKRKYVIYIYTNLYKVNKTQLKNQFCELTTTSLSTATKYLEASNYDLTRSIELYYDKQAEKELNNNNKLNKSTTTTINSKLNKIYDKYKDSLNPNQIDIEGTLKYLEDLDIDPDDPKALSLAFLLNSPKLGIFKKDDFLTIWQYYKVYDLLMMKVFIKNFYNDILHNKNNYIDLKTNQTINFKKFYDFTFKFLIETENQKVLNIELATEYWKLLLPLVISVHNETESNLNKDKIEERINQWYEFLIKFDQRKIITFDTWSMFYQFLIEIIINDPINLSKYDEMAAWPSKIDEYMEYLNENELI
ncbi:DCN1 [Candida jiufengensis]|uniref:DCN1 n=1 Tax=Candida jiufengensis TaxID=497108 RepID=UPI00222505F3|nr:DCN1 [Candida jiufengensis]KAI5952910.1 DCN1 [Candida jiufengensis]